MTLEDAADIFDYAHDLEVTRYVLWQPHRSIDDSQQFLASVVAGYEHLYLADWGIVHKGDRKLIGSCGFHGWRPEHARASLGYVLARAYWGQGYTTEAARAVVAFGFEQMQLNRIQADCHVNNLASARVMEKIGMRCEGILRQYRFVKGAYWDFKRHSILKADNCRG
jgi:ribosomal-protein-alanine N-acetyltransferase